MAKSPAKVSALDQVRSLLTGAETKVLESSMGAAVAKATREQAAAALVHARTLRDKWRDLHEKQTRSTKRSAAAGSAVNQRSREKHEVFADAVKRLEARLTEIAGSVSQAMGMGKSRLTAAAKTPKAARTTASRAKRTSVRGKLKAVVAEMNRTGRPKTAKAAAPKPVAKVGGPKATAAKATAVKTTRGGRAR